MYEKLKRMKCIYPFWRGRDPLVRLGILVVVALLCGISPLRAGGQGDVASLKLMNVKMIDAIKAIENASDYKFVYNNNEVNVDKVITVNTANKDTESVVKEIFSGYDVVFSGNTVIVKDVSKEQQQSQPRQTITVEGVVTDNEGESVIGASILVKGTETHGTVTDIDGAYLLSNVPVDGTLVFSYHYCPKKLPHRFS